ncbi:hypothetical protein ES708_06799 [subsurface metagenome]
MGMRNKSMMATGETHAQKQDYVTAAVYMLCKPLVLPGFTPALLWRAGYFYYG